MGEPVAAITATRKARPIANVWYAEDALRWHHWRIGADSERRRHDRGGGFVFSGGVLHRARGEVVRSHRSDQAWNPEGWSDDDEHLEWFALSYGEDVTFCAVSDPPSTLCDLSESRCWRRPSQYRPVRQSNCRALGPAQVRGDHRRLPRSAFGG